MAGLRGERLWRIPLNGTEAVGRPPGVPGGRVRPPAHGGPAGGDKLWLVTSETDGRGTPEDGDDKILELEVNVGRSSGRGAFELARRSSGLRRLVRRPVPAGASTRQPYDDLPGREVYRPAPRVAVPDVLAGQLQTVALVIGVLAAGGEELARTR